MKILVTADFHLRKDKPRCRLDEDWIDTQKKVVEFIFETALKNDTDVWIIGDVFETSTVPPVIENIIPNILKKKKYNNTNCFILSGNHDLLYHNPKNINKSSIGVLLNSKGVYPLVQSEVDSIICEHILVWPSKEVKPGPAGGLLPDDIFKKYPKASYIFVGDYHQAFTVKNKKGQCIINPGCITRQAADFKDYQPQIYIVDTDTNEITEHFLPDDQLVVTDDYLRRDEDRNDRIDSFVELISGKKKNISLDFQANLKAKYRDLVSEDREEVEDILQEVS